MIPKPPETPHRWRTQVQNHTCSHFSAFRPPRSSAVFPSKIPSLPFNGPTPHSEVSCPTTSALGHNSHQTENMQLIRGQRVAVVNKQGNPQLYPRLGARPPSTTVNHTLNSQRRPALGNKCTPAPRTLPCPLPSSPQPHLLLRLSSRQHRFNSSSMACEFLFLLLLLFFFFLA